jgi:DNA/RNA-binding domain of Phe-tRNA-synthetase-like protein
MIFCVFEECVQLGLRAGAVVFRDVRVGPSGPELLAVIAEECARVRARFASAAVVRSSPEVAAFQEIHRRVGANPRREQSSVERLLTFALQRGRLPAINGLVDAYNLVSIRSGCSLGAHDLDRLALPVSLRVLDSPQSFVPLGSLSPAVANAGEYAYVDARGSILCRLDVVQADFSKVTADTVNALLIIEATSAHSAAAVRKTFTDAVELVLRHCGGTAEVVAFPDPDGVGSP